MTEYAPYTYPQPSRGYAPPSQAKSLQGRAIVAITGLGSGILLTIAGWALSMWAASQSSVSYRSDDLIAVAALGAFGSMFLTLLLAGITFIIWLHQAAKNVEGFGGGLRWTPGWAIGAWFVPIGNLIIPLRMLNEIDRTSESYVQDSSRVKGSRAVYILWAILWTAYLLIGRNLTAFNDFDTEPELAAALSGLGSLMSVAAAACAILMIRRITANQETILTQATDPYAGFPTTPAGYPPHPGQVPYPSAAAGFPSAAPAFPGPAGFPAAFSYPAAPGFPPPAPGSTEPPASLRTAIPAANFPPQPYSPPLSSTSAQPYPAPPCPAPPYPPPADVVSGSPVDPWAADVPADPTASPTEKPQGRQ